MSKNELSKKERETGGVLKGEKAQVNAQRWEKCGASQEIRNVSVADPRTGAR